MPFTLHDAATDAIRRARDLLEASRPPKKGAATALPLPLSVRTDMRRLSIVMAVAALDTYMHRLIVNRVYTHADMPGALAKLDVRFGQLLAPADRTAMAARQDPHNSRPRVGVKQQLRDRLLRETYQRYEDVSKALGMAGSSGRWEAIGHNLSPQMTPNQIRRRLDNIVMRRNHIVHEGDYRRLDRPRNSRRNPIPISEARADIDFLADLIDAIHAVV